MPDVSPAPMKCGRLEPRKETWQLEKSFKIIQKKVIMFSFVKNIFYTFNKNRILPPLTDFT